MWFVLHLQALHGQPTHASLKGCIPCRLGLGLLSLSFLSFTLLSKHCDTHLIKLWFLIAAANGTVYPQLSQQEQWIQDKLALLVTSIICSFLPNQTSIVITNQVTQHTNNTLTF